MGKFYYKAELTLDWFGLEQVSKSVANSSKAKQLIPNNVNRSTTIQ